MTTAEYDDLPRRYQRLPDIVPGEVPALKEKLERMWETPPGPKGWFSTVDHKEIGLRYIVTAFIFLGFAGLEALTMRLQLAGPNATLLTPEQYDELFTMHGLTMIEWYAFPVLTGFAHYLWPLIFGSREVAFPRLEAFGYWVYLFSGIFLYSSFAVLAAPNAGWFDYVPLALRAYDPNINIDFYCLSLLFLNISTLSNAVNLIVTTLRLRCTGMSVNRWPILAWGSLTANAAAILATPALSLAVFLIWLDRTFGTHFYSSGGNVLSGHPLLYQHLFWFWGHPIVYMVVLPAQGMVSDIIPCFCRRPLVGYSAVVLATVSTMMLGFGVWVHHMFATGLPIFTLSYFSAVSVIITIPTGVQVFAWIATIWTGRPVFKTAMLFCAGFIVTLTVGGLSGLMTAMVPVDWEFTDTYFVVAHIHYVLIGINFFGVMAACYYWFPKFTGRYLNETIGKWNFWMSFVFFNIAFFTMHITGQLGMPRRVYTYPEGIGLGIPNMITTVCAYLFFCGILIFIFNVFYSLKKGEPAGPNPWDSHSLEWSVSSPPPSYNFEVIPSVACRHPMWEKRLEEGAGESVLDRGMPLSDTRQTLGVTAIDAEPDVILKIPSDSFMPLALALCIAAMFVGLLVHWWWLAGAAVGVGFIPALAWGWPRVEDNGQRAIPE